MNFTPPSESSGLQQQRARIRELEAASRGLDPGSAQRSSLHAAVHSYAESVLSGLGDRPAYQADRSAVARLRAHPPGGPPLPAQRIIDLLEESVVRPGLLPSHPGHLAYIPGGGLYASALGDYLAAVTDEYAGVRFTGPGAVEIENIVVDWMADLVGMPPGNAGTLTSGGSLASLIAVVSAREAAGLRAADYEKAVVYSTEHVHHCLYRALRIAGTEDATHREIPMDQSGRMRTDQLARQVAQDRTAGLRPWLVLATAGTVDIGAVDPLDELADIAAREDLWLHADAAYGGFFTLVDSVRPMFRGLGRADSVVLDPHKGLFLPYGTGAVLVRDRAAITRAHRSGGAYLQDVAIAEQTGPSPAAVSPELSRHFRGLRLWMPLMLHGLDPFRACLEEKLHLARYFHTRVSEMGFETGPPPQLSVVTYRWTAAGGDPDAFNRALLDEVLRDGRVFLSSTLIEGRFTLRMAALAFRTRLATIDLALDVLAGALERTQARHPH